MPSSDHPAGRFTFPRRVRLRSRREFVAVYEQRVSRRVGGLVVYVAPNGLDVARLGVSIPKKVGNAVRRNHVRRRLREAFRSIQHDLPAGYDVVVNVHPHEPAKPEAYATMIGDAVRSLERRWTRSTRSPSNDPPRTEGAPREGSA